MVTASVLRDVKPTQQSLRSRILLPNISVMLQTYGRNVVCVVTEISSLTFLEFIFYMLHKVVQSWTQSVAFDIHK
jgi:hypothetical protein